MFSKSKDQMNLPKHLPLLLVGDAILMPGSSKRIKIDTPRNVKLVREHLLRSTSLRSTIIGVIPETVDPSSYGNIPTSIHSIGTAAIAVQVTGTNWPNPEYTLLVHGMCRFNVDKVVQHTPYITAQVTKLGKWPSEPDDAYLQKDDVISELTSALRRETFQLINTLDVSDPLVSRLKSIISDIPDHALPDLIVAVLRSTLKEKLDILDAVDLKDRLQRTMPLIVRQLEHMKLSKERNANRKMRGDDVNDVIVIRGSSSKDKQNRFRIVQSKEGDLDDDGDDLQALEKKIRAADMPDDVYKIVARELKRLRKMPVQLPDHSSTRNYIELVSELPWSLSSNDRVDIEQATLDLDKDHYSMEKLKKRVLEYLAVKKLNRLEAGVEMKGPILCFVGPPGVGKTSLGKSIAKALGRKFHRISLGGVCDQSDIRGHRRTYVGSMPGRIISGLKTVAVNNPVFLLDEVDKLGKGIQGDPGAALLEVLDPEQNHLFVDHYLNIPFDLSSVLFIATANTTSTIPPALLDRMEVIEVPGYTQEEKVKIAQLHLLPKQLSVHGLERAAKVTVAEDAVQSLVANYTREAGVRNLERVLAGLCRAIALDVTKQDVKDRKPNRNVEKGDLTKYLGPCKFDDKEAQHLTKPGVATGLAWTKAGGVILYVEASRLLGGNGDIILTGQLGDVMKESAQIAVSWLRSNAIELGINGEKILHDTDIHIHFPEGAVGKDGPSAGVTMVTALVSLFTGKLVKSNLAMTGEITLQGLVLPVGGIKEKVLAALRSGMTEVVLPMRNKRDVEADLSKEVQDAIGIRYVRTLEEVLAQALTDEDVSSVGIPRCKL